MDLRIIWSEFILELGAGVFSPARILPYPGLEDLRVKLGDILRHLTPALLSAADQRIEPEVKECGNRVHFILPLGADVAGHDFCFSFLVEDGQWYFQHVENLFIRLDHTGTPPVSTFPDLSETKKAWARDEIQISEMTRLYNFLQAEKGREFALNWFKDGAGYLIGVRAWIPFVPLPEAFIYYACWDLANLHANPIILAALDEKRAVITGTLRYFELYQQAAHLERWIDRDEYRHLFDIIWKDRAECAGWHLQIEVDGTNVRMNFTRMSS